MESRNVFIIYDESSIIKLGKKMELGILLLTKPIPAYKILKENSIIWQYFHVHLFSNNIDRDILEAIFILISERRKLVPPNFKYVKEKPLNRRMIFRLWENLREYINSPVKGVKLTYLNSNSKKILSQICPFGAMSEDLDMIKEQKCTECGVCYSFMPIQVLENPLLPFDGVREMLSFLAKKDKKVIIVYFDINREEEFYEKIKKRHDKIIGIPIINSLVPWWLPYLHYIYRVNGIIVAEKNEYLDYILKDVNELGLDKHFKYTIEMDLESLEDLDDSGRKEIINVHPNNIVTLTVDELSKNHRTTETFRPLATRSFVPVLNDNCIFCGACVKSCPYNALEIESEPKVPRLLLKLNACQGCYNCMYVCPTYAIIDYEPLISNNGYKTLAHDELLKCVVCGAPVGSKRKIEYVERKMIEKGLERDKVMQITRICATCRTRNIVHG